MQRGFPSDPVTALRARELLADVQRLVAAGSWKDAAPRSVALVRMAPGLAEAHELMGRVAMETGASKIASDCFERALSIGPVTSGRLQLWGKALLALRQPAGAEKAFRRALAIRPDDPDLLMDLVDALLNQGRQPEALKTLRKVLRKQPDNRLANHFAAALTRKGAPHQDYVTHLFDGYASYFDEHLTQTLHYSVPEALAAMLSAQVVPDDTALDLGCGTGLVAAALASRPLMIDGIDLAPKMVEKARATGRYRTLAVGDCVTVMTSDPGFAGPYGLITAADVFIYMGELEAVFLAMRARLASGGLIALSIEATNAADIEIRASGRFAHSPAYVVALARRFELATLAEEQHTIRQEQGYPIDGQLYLLRAQ